MTTKIESALRKAAFHSDKAAYFNTLAYQAIQDTLDKRSATSKTNTRSTRITKVTKSSRGRPRKVLV